MKPLKNYTYKFEINMYVGTNFIISILPTYNGKGTIVVDNDKYKKIQPSPFSNFRLEDSVLTAT